METKYILTRSRKKVLFEKGFSLIEVLVSLSIFTIVMTISVGSLMVLINANAKAQNTQSVLTNISYALDSMTREMRTGSDYFCGQVSALPTSGITTRDCVSGDVAFSFNEGGDSLTGTASSRRIGYRLNAGSIERRLGDGSWAPVTSPDIDVTELRFYSSGTTRGDSVSPTVTLYLKGVAGENDGSQGTFNIQTTVVQQLLDI